MPTNVLIVNGSEELPILSVLATDNGLRSPEAVTIPLTNLTPNAGGDVIIAAGTWIGEDTGGNPAPLSAGKVTANSAVAVVKMTGSQQFAQGQTLEKANGDAVGTIASIQSDGVTLTVAPTTAVVVGDTLVRADVDPTSVRGLVVNRQNLTQHGNDVALYRSCTVYRDRMPYFPDAIADLFPEIIAIAP